MRTRVQKWGNSLAVRIPKSFALQTGLHEHASIDLSVVDDKLLIEPILEREVTLDRLLAGVTDENVHREIDTGPAVGNESW